MMFWSELKSCVKRGVAALYRENPSNDRKFAKWRQFLEISQWWDKGKLETLQSEKLREMVQYAVVKVPYYKRKFAEWGLTGSEIRDLGDLKRVPFLNKRDVLENVDQMVATGLPKRRGKYVTTAGSTGKPFGFYWDKTLTVPLEAAFVSRWRSWGGYRSGDAIMVLESNIKSGKENSRTYYENPFNNSLVIAYPMILSESAEGLLNKIEKFSPRFVRGYPSAVSVLSEFCHENRGKFRCEIQAVFTSSETLQLSQREMIEDVFHCKVIDLYGHTERVGAAAQCERCKDYHVFSEYGIIEIIDERGKVINEPGKIGEIVSTGFCNFVMPFIRYRTGDYAEYAGEACSCGRGLPTIRKIAGRLQEFLITKKKTLLSVTSLNMHNKLFENVIKYQFIQKEYGKAEMVIVPKKEFASKDSSSILNKIKEKSSDLIDLKLRIVDSIEGSKSGKQVIVKQKVKLEKFSGLSMER